MLFCNGERLNLSAPSTEMELKVSSQFGEIKEKYGLLKGRRIRFVFPKKYIVPNRFDPKKVDKPRSFRIGYKTTLHTPTGTETWVYAKNIGREKNGATRYLPPSRIFTGDISLGLNDIDEIYFLLYKYPRTEGGMISSSLPKFIAIFDEDVEATIEIQRTQERIVLESKLYLSVDQGGLSDAQVEKLAVQLNFSGVKEKSPAVLRKDCLNYLRKVGDGALILQNFLSKEQGKAPNLTDVPMVKIMDDVMKAEELGIIDFYRVGKSKGWRFQKGQIPGEKIINVVNDEQRHEELAAHLAANPELLDSITALM